MRLALTHAYGWPEVRRGGERYIHELSSALARRGHDVTLFIAGSQPGMTMEDGLTTVKFRRHFASPDLHERDFAELLAPALVSGRFDCVHSLGPYEVVSGLEVAHWTEHRSVYTNLGSPVRTWWDKLQARDAHEAVVRDVDAYGCLSRFAMQALAEDYGREGVLTPGGVDLERFNPASQREPDPTILFTSALDEPRKGLGVLVAGFRLLLQSEPSARLWLSGPGDGSASMSEAPPQVRDRIEKLPLGEARELGELYGRAWVCALPAKAEAFGLVVLESFACGTPVAVADDGALPELVTRDTGALCDPDDPRSVADALASAIAISRGAGVVDACRSVAASHDWTTGVAPKLEPIYSGKEDH